MDTSCLFRKPTAVVSPGRVYDLFSHRLLTEFAVPDANSLWWSGPQIRSSMVPYFVRILTKAQERDQQGHAGCAAACWEHNPDMNRGVAEGVGTWTGVSMGRRCYPRLDP